MPVTGFEGRLGTPGRGLVFSFFLFRNSLYEEEEELKIKKPPTPCLWQAPRVLAFHVPIEVQKLTGLQVTVVRWDPRFRECELVSQALDLIDGVML